MPKFIKQTNPFNCGPTAILNALKWAGMSDATLSLIPTLEFSCRLVNFEEGDVGTTDHDFDRVIRYAGQMYYTVVRPETVTIGGIDNHLESGGSIAIGYVGYGSTDGGHFCFISEKVGSSYAFINDSKDKTKILRRRKTMIQLLRSPKTLLWFLSKKPTVNKSENPDL